jgi:DNA polymerase-3 subunit epsilon
LDYDLDDVIELAMVKFTLNRAGEVGEAVSDLRGLRQPRGAIPPRITELTGIKNDDVLGKEIDSSIVGPFLDGVQLVIAHNAAFDRPFCERLWPQFRDLPWACSATQIDWQGEGISGSRLEYILANFGRFYSAHRAADDCFAVLFALSQQLQRSDERALEQLLRNARKTQARMYAVGATYELRLALKRRGYRWNDGMDGFPRAWWRDLELDDVDREKAFLAGLDPAVLIEPLLFKLTARNRFRRALD